MSKADALVSVGKLMAAYRQEKLREETIQVYAEELADLRPDALAIAVVEIIRRSKFFPSVAEIREETKEVLRGLPTPTPKWMLGAGPEVEIPMCSACGKHQGFLERDGKPVCFWCQVGPGGSRSDLEGKEVSEVGSGDIVARNATEGAAEGSQ